MAVNNDAGDMEQKTRTFITQAMTLGLFLVGVFLLLGRPMGMAGRRGFFGTRGTLFDDFGLLFELAALAGLWYGTKLARDGRIYAHQYVLTTSVTLNALVILLVVLPRLAISVGRLGLWHAAFALPSLLLGLYLLLRMFRLIPRGMRVSGWRLMMRVTLALYTAAAALALFSYIASFLL